MDSMHETSHTPKNGELKKLHAHNKRLLSLMELVPFGLLELDREGDCVYVNESWCQMSGRTGKQSFGSGWIAAVSPDDRPALEKEYTRMLAGKNEFQMQCRLMNTEHTDFFILLRAKILFDEDRAVSGFLITVIDITELKKREREILEKNEQLEKFNQLAVGRELKMIQLKKEIEEFQKKHDGT